MVEEANSAAVENTVKEVDTAAVENAVVETAEVIVAATEEAAVSSEVTMERHPEDVVVMVAQGKDASMTE